MDGAATPDAIGRYAIAGEIAAGGFGTVYRATDPLLGRELAVKVLHSHLARDPQVRARFLAEGRALAAVRHPHLIQVHDAGEADGRAYLAMEYVPGYSLAEATRHGPLAAAEVVRITAQVAGALDAVHAAGLVHRDVKPANILLADDGRAVLLDLGIAHRLGEQGLTGSSVLVGTPGYLAPEQLRGGAALGPATDVYQLGATIYTLLAGRPPFDGDLATVMYAVAHEPPLDLGEQRPDLPPAVVAAVTRALAKLPANRPASAGAFATELGGGPVTPPAMPAHEPRHTAAATTPAAKPAAGDAGNVAPQPSRGGARWPVVLGGVCLLGLALGLLGVTLRREDRAPDTAPALDVQVASATAVAAAIPSPTAAPPAAAPPSTSPPTAAPTPGQPTPSPAATPASMTAPTPPPPAPPPAAVPAAVQALVGQRVTACNYSVDFEVAVARVEWSKTVLDSAAPGNGMWIVAIIDVTNLGTKAEALVTRPLQLRDERGREYNVREYPPDPVELFRAYRVHAAFQRFEPGITEQSVVTFQVPDTVGPLTLAGKRDFC